MEDNIEYMEDILDTSYDNLRAELENLDLQSKHELIGNFLDKHKAFISLDNL